MELQGYSVSGFRCLATTTDIHLRRPTILTGANDGGKTTALAALAFLLGGPAPSEVDRTIARDEDNEVPGGTDQGRFAEIRVTGRFSLTDGEAEELREPADIRLRRCFRNGGAMYEYRTTVCSDPALRNLGNKSLEDLKGLADRFDITITGHTVRKATFLEPIQEHAASLPTEEAWTTAPNKLVGALPHLITFRDDDPEAAIRQALMGVYRSVLQDDQITTQLSAVESHTRDVLKSEANKLRDHLRLRCPELADIPDRSADLFSRSISYG